MVQVLLASLVEWRESCVKAVLKISVRQVQIEREKDKYPRDVWATGGHKAPMDQMSNTTWRVLYMMCTRDQPALLPAIRSTTLRAS